MAEPAKDAQKKPRDVRWSFPLFLRKFSELGLMATLVGGTIAYHLSLPQGLLRNLATYATNLRDQAYAEESRSLVSMLVFDIFPLLEAALPILELKTTVFLLLAVLFIGVHTSGRVFEKISGQKVYPTDVAREEGKRDWYRLVPIICIIGFLLWSLLSFSPWGWSPKPPPETLRANMVTSVEAEEGGSFIGKLVGASKTPRASSFHSFVAWAQTAIVLFFFIVAEDIIRRRRLVYKILGLLFGLGIAAAFFSIATHAEIPGISSIWVDWPDSEYRNDVGGFIGHNTAVSSYLMAPFLLCWTLLLAHRNRIPAWVKFALYVCLAAMGLTLILAQSRGVVPIIIVSFGFLVYSLRERATLRPPQRFWILVPLAIIILLITQFIPHPKNPFYRESLPLQQRLQHITGEHLLSETRLRIFAASIPVIQENFLTGTGFGTFHYVFPEAQGEFYRDNPETPIVPTAKKTFRAHNEYLQTVFETGVVGLLFALVGIGTVLLSGWRTLGSSFRQRHVAIELAVLVSVCALLAHCFLDFPLRVAPLCVSLVMLLAICSAGDRLWLLEVKELDDRKSVDDNDTATPVSEPMNPVYRSDVTGIGAVGVWFLTTVAIVGVGVFFASAGTQWFSAKQALLRGTQYIELYFDARGTGDPLTNEYLLEADSQLLTASRLSPLIGEIYYRRANVLQIQAANLNSMKRDVERTQGAEAGRAMEMRAQSAARDSVEFNNRSMSEYRFHGSYRQRGSTQWIWAGAETGNKRRDLRFNAIEDLARAVEMNPGDPTMIINLLTWLEDTGELTDRRAIDLYAKLHRFHPNRFFEDVVVRALRMRSLAEHDLAYELLDRAHRVAPDNRKIIEYLAIASFTVGETERTQELLKLLPVNEVEMVSPMAGQLAARTGNFDRALNLVNRSFANESEYGAIYRDGLARVIRIMRDYDQGQEKSAEDRIKELIEVGKEEPILLDYAAAAAEEVFGNIELSKQLIEAYLEFFEGEIIPHIWTSVARYNLLSYSNEFVALQVALRDARANGTAVVPPRNASFIEALRTARDAYRNAYEITAAQASDPAIRGDARVLARRLSDLERLLGAIGE